MRGPAAAQQRNGGAGAAAAGDQAGAEWNPEEIDRFSFDDSDRFEEDSLCSWSSEPESLCNNWRGWKKPYTNGNNNNSSNNGGAVGVVSSSLNGGTVTSLGQSTSVASLHMGNGGSGSSRRQGECEVPSLTELAAKCVASYIPFELVEHVYPPVPEQLQLRIAYWSFPDNEEDIRLYSCLANSSAEEFNRGDQLFKNRAVKDPLQIGFHLSATVVSIQPRAHFNVAVTFDRRRISSCNCTCTSTAYWCSHVVAVCLHRIHCSQEVCLRAPVSESLTRLQRDQLQKFAQYLISELPQQILPTAQRLLDELLSAQPTAINTVCGAPDPTAGASANDQTSWFLDEKTLHDNIKRILIKFCLPAPIVFSDVNYLTNSAPPAAAEWSSLLRPLRGREPEGMWNLLSIVREMYRRCDRNAVRLLEIITEECMACDQILIWWFQTKLSLLAGSHGHSGGKHGNPHSNSNAAQHACSSLCDEIVVLWRLAALNPGLAPDERDMLHAQFTAWHLKILDRVVKSRMLPSSFGRKQDNSKSDAEVFVGFKPAIEACYLDWEQYPIAGVTHTQDTNPIYYSPFTCFKHTDTKNEVSNSQLNATQALMANNKHYNYISASNDRNVHTYKSRYDRPFRERFYISSSNNSSNSSSDSVHVRVHQQAAQYATNPSAGGTSNNGVASVSGMSGAGVNNSMGAGGGNSGNIVGCTTHGGHDIQRSSGNRSSASSEGFCENEDFGGDSSGNNMGTEGGHTLEPENLKISQQSADIAAGIVKVKHGSESDSQGSIELESSPGVDDIELATGSRVEFDFKPQINSDVDGQLHFGNNMRIEHQENNRTTLGSYQVNSLSSGSSLSSASSASSSASSSPTSSSSSLLPIATGLSETVEAPVASSSGIAASETLPISLEHNIAENRRISKDESFSSSSDEFITPECPSVGTGMSAEMNLPAASVSVPTEEVFVSADAPSVSHKTTSTQSAGNSNNFLPQSSEKPTIFSNVSPTIDAWDILLARAEGLHAHGHGREASILAVRLAEEMLAHPPDLMAEQPPPVKRKGKKQNNMNQGTHKTSVLASSILSKCAFLCTVLSENSEHSHIGFRICLFALEIPRHPASTKPLEVKLANQEADILALLKKIPLNQPELRVIRERAELLKNGTLKLRGEALLPINLASFVFDALVMPSLTGKENRIRMMSIYHRTPSDENLGFEAAVAALGLKANVSEAEHPLLCEGTRRQRGDLALTLLSYYKDEPRKIAKIMEKLLDRDIQPMFKATLLPAYYTNNPPVRTPATQVRREEHEYGNNSQAHVSNGNYIGGGINEIFHSDYGSGGGNSRPHSSTSAELEVNMGALNVSAQSNGISGSGSNAAPLGNGQAVASGSNPSSRTSKDNRYKGKRAYPSIPNQPSEASAHFMFELAKNVLTKAGGTSSTSLFTQATTNHNHHGPHRALHMCAFQLGLYALGLHNCVSPNWLSRTYSSHVSWIIGQAMEIGAPAISFFIDTWEGHLTPPEAAGMADRASRGWDSYSVYPAAELALSVLPHSAALNPNEIQRAILQCKEQSDLMLERACITVENAAKGGGVYPEVLFQVARYWYELYLRNTPNSEHEQHDDVDHSVSLSALIESQQEMQQASQSQQQVQQQVVQQQQQPPLPPQNPQQQVVVTTAPPPFQQGVTTLAPIGITPYPPYSFCQGIYHHHNITYPTNQMQMYISAGPPPHPAYQTYPPPQQGPPAQQSVVAPPPVPYVQPGTFQQLPPQAYQAIPCTTNAPPPFAGVQIQTAPPPPQPHPQQIAAANMQAYYGQPPPQAQMRPAPSGVYPFVQQQQMPTQQQQPPLPQVRQRHPHQFSPTQLRYLLAAYNVGMLAMETLARRVHDDRPQAKYARNPPYGEDVKWLLRISKKLGTQYLHQFCVCAVNSIVSPFVLHDVAIESAHYLGRNNHQLVMQHLRSALTPLVQKCQQMYIQCIHQKLYHLTQADYEDFASIILAARAAFQITPEGNVQFKDWLQSIKRSKSCKKELWTQINAALQSNSK